MSVRFVNIDRQTPMLLPMDLREWVREDDLAHFVLEAVEGLDVSLAAINERGSGSEQYPPSMMMALLLYCYAQGIFSSRRIEAATYCHVSVRYLAGNTHPDHDTIASFRRANRELVRATFVRVLELGREVGLLRVGAVVVDGTKLWANASKRATLSQSELEEQLRLLEGEVDELLKRAEVADAQEKDDGGTLPRELADRAQRRAKLEAAKLALKEKAEQRAQAEAKERERAQREGCERPGPCSPSVRPKDTINSTDKDSALQPTAREGFIQGYNAQTAVSLESGLIVAAHVVRDTGDRRQLVPTVAAIPPELGSLPTAIIADTGYDNAAQILEIERTTGACVYCALQPPNRRGGRRGNTRKSQRRSAPERLRQRMKARLQTEEGRRLYSRRKSTVEPVFGMIKSVLGFRRFGLRGLRKVNLEWQLLGAAFNCRRLAARHRQRR